MNGPKPLLQFNYTKLPRREQVQVLYPPLSAIHATAGFHLMATLKTNPGSKQPAVRKLTITEHIRINVWSTKSVPFIRLCGIWLDEAGFKPNQKILVTTTDNQLIIRPAGDE